MPQSTAVMDMTFNALSRYIPHLSNIIAVASFTHLYHGNFNKDGEFSWASSGVEGSLFVCATSDQQYHLVIFNRKGVSNFIWTLTSAEGVECDSTIEIAVALHKSCGYSSLGKREDDPECYGIWVYSREGESTHGEGERIAAAILECAKAAENGSDVAESHPVTPTPQLHKMPQPPPQSRSPFRSPATPQQSTPSSYSPTPEQQQQQQQQQPMAGVSILSHVFPDQAPSQSQQQQQPEYQEMAQVQAMQQHISQQLQQTQQTTDVLNMLFQSARQHGH